MKYIQFKDCKIEPTGLICPACQKHLLQKIKRNTDLVTDDDYSYFLMCSDLECSFLGSPKVDQCRNIVRQIQDLGLEVLDFSSSTVVTYNPARVNFTRFVYGYNIDTFTWDFGDGSTEITTKSEVYHDYKYPGQYTVTLSGFDKVKREVISITKNNLIDVAPYIPPSANFTMNPPSGNNTLLVKFTDLSTGSDLNQWNWDFGDGSKKSTDQNPEHFYDKPGIYTVQLTVVNIKKDSDTLIKPRVIMVHLTAPLAGFNTDVSNGYAPLTVKFKYAYEGQYFPSKFKWNFGDGTTSTEVEPTHVYTNSGSYHVQLEVENDQGTDAIRKNNAIIVLQPTIVNE